MFPLSVCYRVTVGQHWDPSPDPFSRFYTAKPRDRQTGCLRAPLSLRIQRRFARHQKCLKPRRFVAANYVRYVSRFGLHRMHEMRTTAIDDAGVRQSARLFVCLSRGFAGRIEVYCLRCRFLAPNKRFIRRGPPSHGDGREGDTMVRCPRQFVQ